MIFDEEEMLELCEKYGIKLGSPEENDQDISMEDLMKEPKIIVMEVN